MGENRVREEDESSWREGQKANPYGVWHSRLSPHLVSSWPHAAQPSTVTDCGEQHQEKSYLREEIPANKPGTGGKGVLGPCSEVAGSPLVTLTPHPIRVLLPISSVTLSSTTCLGTNSDTAFFCLSLVAQYPQPSWAFGWKSFFFLSVFLVCWGGDFFNFFN